MAISKINRFIALFDTAFRALPAPVSMADTERLALLVHHAMESKKRVYHTSGHVFGMCEGMRPLQVLAALRESGGDLESLLGGLRLYPQKLINVPIVRGFPWRDDPSITAALASVEGRMSGRGRVLLRASGTEPLLRVMVEGEDADVVRAAAEELAAVVREAAL